MFSKTVEYALRAAVALTRSRGDTMTSEVLSRVTGGPARYVSKLMRDLVFARIVTSTPGPRGGYLLSRSPELITVHEIIAAVAILPRSAGRQASAASGSGIVSLVDSARNRLRSAFEATTLADLAGRSGRVLENDSAQKAVHPMIEDV